MDYPLIWFLLVGVLWTGYLVLEGFDFGVGALLPVLGGGGARVGPAVDEADQRRRVMLTSIGPHWDGNEVWLITAGGAMFAAFPEWYASMFSAFYLPLLLMAVSSARISTSALSSVSALVCHHQELAAPPVQARRSSWPSGSWRSWPPVSGKPSTDRLTCDRGATSPVTSIPSQYPPARKPYEPVIQSSPPA